jgi:DNA-binding response OmpR family regulator
MTERKILIIEDDASIAEIERDFLEIEGFTVTIEADGNRGAKRAVAENYQAVILDLMLPGMDGYEICRTIRNQIAIPILMVTAKTQEAEKLRGLGLGADDYISKPFSPTELVARVKANLAQFERIAASHDERTDKTELTAGPLRVNLQNHVVYVEGERVEFKNREFELLVHLMHYPNRVFSKEQLYESLWGLDALGDIRTVAVHINRLREKIEKNPSRPHLIQTVWGVGYRLSIQA